jgi:hypothetical protein
MLKFLLAFLSLSILFLSAQKNRVLTSQLILILYVKKVDKIIFFFYEIKLRPAYVFLSIVLILIFLLKI